MSLAPAQPLDSAEEPQSPEFVRALESLRSRRSFRDPQLREAANAQRLGLLDQSEEILAGFLADHPHHPDALYLRGQIYMLQQRFPEAEPFLAECVAIDPDFDAARFNYAKSLLSSRPQEAMTQLDILLAKDARNPLYRDLKAIAFSTLGDHAAAAACYRDLTNDFPASIDLWMSYGQALRTTGRRDECVAAYRRVLELDPGFGGAYWSMGELKTFRFSVEDVEAMNAQLKRTDLTSSNRTYFHFALGKAYADLQQHQKSFENYSRANALRRIAVEYDAEATSRTVSELMTLFTPEFFEERRGFGNESGAPIFVLGMHRSGSTLVEQILSSHSAIEGAGELRGIPVTVRFVEDELGPLHGADYPAVLGKLDDTEVRSLADRYLASMVDHRPRGRPFFIDKQPYNFWYVGLIHLMFPNAKIIDVRRHPLGCCLSNFTMNFRHGLHYSYRQSDLGRYYADYVRLMAHFDAVLPGTVHRVIYERLVTDTEGEVRRLLDYLGLPFEDSCLRFHETERAIDTASSEQVRRPIFDEGVDRWRNYEPWLGPLKQALGSVLDAYPDVPGFAP